MKEFDLSGPEFLILYFCLSVIVILSEERCFSDRSRRDRIGFAQTSCRRRSPVSP
jgi:hypothetical protein